MLFATISPGSVARVIHSTVVLTVPAVDTAAINNNNANQKYLIACYSFCSCVPRAKCVLLWKRPQGSNKACCSRLVSPWAPFGRLFGTRNEASVGGSGTIPCFFPVITHTSSSTAPRRPAPHPPPRQSHSRGLRTIRVWPDTHRALAGQTRPPRLQATPASACGHPVPSL